MVDMDKLNELDSHWKEVMDLAVKYGFFIGQAAGGGTTIFIPHKKQLEMFGEEEYICHQRNMFGIDMEVKIIEKHKIQKKT